MINKLMWFCKTEINSWCCPAPGAKSWNLDLPLGRVTFLPKNLPRCWESLCPQIKANLFRETNVDCLLHNANLSIGVPLTFFTLNNFNNNRKRRIKNIQYKKCPPEKNFEPNFKNYIDSNREIWVMKTGTR